MTCCRPHRSASTPPRSRKTTSGIVYAASTIPREAVRSSTARTANASATGDIVVPARFTERDRKYHLNGRSRRGDIAEIEVTPGP